MPHILPIMNIIDDSKIHNERELWSGGLDEALIEILNQETLEGKISGSKIHNCDLVCITNHLSTMGTKMIDSNQIREKIT